MCAQTPSPKVASFPHLAPCNFAHRIPSTQGNAAGIVAPGADTTTVLEQVLRPDANGVTVLHLAVAAGDKRLFRLLVDFVNRKHATVQLCLVNDGVRGAHPSAGLP